jgi:hypothetical protein
MVPRLRALPFPAHPARSALLAVLPLALAPLVGCASTSSAHAPGGAATTASTATVPPGAQTFASSMWSTSPAQPYTAPAAATATPRVLLAEGGDVNGTVLFRPACGSGCPLSGDGTTALWNMTWTAWDSTQADGTGTEKIDDCNPNCAAGTLHAVAVRVALSKPVMVCQSGKAAWYWTRVIFTWPDGLPAVFSGDNAPTNPFDYPDITARQATSCP